jgi:hypothetical protein
MVSNENNLRVTPDILAESEYCEHDDSAYSDLGKPSKSEDSDSMTTINAPEANFAHVFEEAFDQTFDRSFRRAYERAFNKAYGKTYEEAFVSLHDRPLDRPGFGSVYFLPYKVGLAIRLGQVAFGITYLGLAVASEWHSIPLSRAPEELICS